MLDEVDGLLAQSAGYICFIDAIFLPQPELLAALAACEVRIGIWPRIDLWNHARLDVLGRAGCVSLEAGVESIAPEGRVLPDRQCRLSTDELAERLIYAKKIIAFVPAHLLDARVDDARATEAWRRHLQRHRVWANAPVPLFPYPGSLGYTRKWAIRMTRHGNARRTLI